MTHEGREVNRDLRGRTCNREFELLAYLAIHPNGTVSKDQWPESNDKLDDLHVRVHLNRLRQVLARAVPKFPIEAVRCDRNGVCWLDPRIIASDAQEFRACCQIGDPKERREEAKDALGRAVELYQGELLNGAGEVKYFWADEHGSSGLSERDSFRREYRRAMRNLGRLHLRDGEVDEAIPLFKQLLEEEPTLEDMVRDLLRYYEQKGDLELVQRTEEDLRAALARAYGKPREPERQTVTLFSEICARVQGQKKSAA